MSRTDKTKPWWVRNAEHHPVEDHDHRNGVCDLPATPYDETDRIWWYDCQWRARSLFGWRSCCSGCGCRMCTDYWSRRWERRRDRHQARMQARLMVKEWRDLE